MNRDGKRPVSVEDLLRLKRAERPPDSFWADFDRQLRAKQLAALVEKRPWWQGGWSLGGAFAGLRRHPLPLGAAVAFGVAFVALRPGMAPEVAAPAVSSSAVAQVVSGPIASVVAPEASISPRVQIEAPVPAPVFAAVVSAQPLQTAPADAIEPSSESSAPALAFTSAERESDRPLFVASVPLSLEAQSSLLMTQSEPLSSGALLGGATRLEARAPASRAVVEPLRQMTPPADRRGSRILTALVSMASVENAMRTTERAANRLSEEQLYEQIRRVGAVGAAVNVKF
jgi:hypothetical protein